MSDNNFVLYVDSNYLSPYAMSVFVTLVEKKIPFKIKKINLKTKENYKSDYARLSLTRRVPTLIHGDFALSESSAITEYIDELYSTPEHAQVYPKNLQEKARARQIQAWLRSDFLPIREERSTEVVFCNSTAAALSEPAQESAGKLFAAIGELLVDNASNLFAEWCIADTDLALMLNRLVLHGDYVPEKLATYARNQWKRASVQQWVGQSRQLSESG